VENIVAQGFGSATDMESSDNQNLEGSGLWEADRWSVVVKRPLDSEDKYDVRFREGGVTPVSFAVWDGSEGHGGGRKAVSTWYYVGLETEEKATTYILPVLAFIAAAGIEAGLVLWIRRRRG
jgi:DMSO reductase family type II enzyme heme b subunit